MSAHPPTLDRQQVLTVLNLYLDWPRSCDALGDKRTNGAANHWDVLMDAIQVHAAVTRNEPAIWKMAK